ncbi:response regulator [Pseudonocardia sp. ICBG1034]|uniref:response regulator n=1 Tax=Pseudonocardia sp. ICBG1034 TaxID=2844381 RepID=UPI0035A8FFD7
MPQTVLVADGVEVLTRVRRGPVDALVLDVMMPALDGLGVCRVLRADGDRAPVLMPTARVETPDRVTGHDADADDRRTRRRSTPTPTTSSRWRGGAGP